jgi:G3E family GTPase
LTTIPVTILGGYLGAGKTTLVNALLRRAGGRRLAVLVNEFGALPIDEDLIERRAGDLMTIAGGCICCSYGSDLVGALVDLAARRPGPDYLIIETSGVALPGAVAQALSLIAGLSLDGIVVLADAETLPARAADRYLADTIARQLADADLLVLTKLDLLTGAQAEERRRWLRGTWPGLRVVEAVRGDIPIDLVLGRHHRDGPDTIAAPAHMPDYVSFGLRVLGPVRPHDFARTLAAADPRLLRAKGFVADEAGMVHAVQVVGRRGESAPCGGRATLRDLVACIGLPGLSFETLATALAALVEVVPVATAPGARWPVTAPVSPGRAGG